MAGIVVGLVLFVALVLRVAIGVFGRDAMTIPGVLEVGLNVLVVVHSAAFAYALVRELRR